MRARMAEIVNKLGEFNTVQNFTKEDMVAINALNDEQTELKRNIDAKTLLAGMNAVSEAPVARAAAPVAPVAAVKPIVENGFHNVGSFYKAVASSSAGTVDARLRVINSANEKYGEDGGFLIPEDFRSEIQSAVEGDESLLGMTRQFKTSSNSLVLPVSETAPWDGSGIQAFWEGESQSSDTTKPVFRQASLRLHKLTALVRVSEELLEDAPALESWIKTEAPEAFTYKINGAIIDGDGVGKPMGVLRSGFKVQVPAEAGQEAGTIVTENVVKMYSRMLPKGITKAFWMCNPQALEQLRLLRFDVGANSPVPVYMPPAGLSVAPYGTLLGRPIMPMMAGVKQLGTEGDFCFVDLSHYITALKTSGIKSQVSTHVYFDRGETAFRFTIRVAGECPYSKPVKTEHGDYEMSGIITLEDR